MDERGVGEVTFDDKDDEESLCFFVFGDGVFCCAG